MIVVATEDFEIYHDAVEQLRARGVEFTTMVPGEELPDATEAVIVGPEDSVDSPEAVERVVARRGSVRRAVEAALATVRTGGGRTIVGVDPGEQPGIAVLSGAVVVAAFQVPIERAPETIRQETADAIDPVVRIGDGARLTGARIIEALESVRVELVDETGTTPYLGAGARGMDDVLAAVNIARLEGEVVENRDIEPTSGELQIIQNRSREQSPTNRAIPKHLARRVAAGELTVEDALSEHRTDADAKNGE